MIKKDNIITKIRVVFDASCKTTSGASLNDCLMVGSNMQEDLFSIVLRLRRYRYAMSADIVKMYRQIRVAEEHGSLQHILWRWNRDEPIRAFNLNTVTYGMASSSFLAIRCLLEVVFQMRNMYPEASEMILRDFYVDDLLTGADSVEALKQLKQDVATVLAGAGFELGKWRSNIPKCFDCDAGGSAVTLGKPTKILGLLWNPVSDTFHYQLKLENRDKVTKRNILSEIS